MADILINQVAWAEDQADIQLLLESLIRDHLQEVLDTNDLPPPDPPVGLAMCQDVLSIASDALRQDGDVLSSELLQAALRLNRALTEDDPEYINNFLQRATGAVIGGKAKKFTAYLESILLQLSRRKWFGLEQPSSPTNPAEFRTLAAASEACVTLYVGDRVMALMFHDILPTFWGTQLDTDCHSCLQPIVDEPSMRTIARVDPSPAAVLGAHVRVTNRHFSCLKTANIPWTPVSHSWDESIRRVTDSDPNTHDDEAAFTLLKTLTALLDASVDAYSSKVEFWHDYFSVPQWEPLTKEALLLSIPALYHDAQEILVQMPDIPGSYITMLYPRPPGKFSASMALRFMPVLHALCSSEWMERMWVLLEYSLCRSACVMDKSDHIWRRPDEAIGMGRDTFTTFVQNGHNVLLELFRYAKSFASNLKDGFLAGLTNKKDAEQRDLCLGEALELIARTKCKLFRDRFLAVHMLTNKNSPPNVPTIPRDATDACQWVWKAALVKRDFSPLLLQPRESNQGSNPTVGMPSWVTGYSGLDHAEWDLGNQRTSPQSIISLEDGLVRTELDIVGKIEKIHYLDIEESGEVTGVKWAIGILGSMNGTEASTKNLSAAELVDGLSRIFPFDSIHTTCAQLVAGVVYTLEGRQAQDHQFKSKVEKCLAEYFAAASMGPQQQYAAQKLTQLLRYDTHIMGDLSAEVTRLTKPRHIARSRHQRGAVNGKPICEVRCQESACRVLTVFRLDLRTNAEVEDKVYRIPGLSYAKTLREKFVLGLAFKIRNYII